jgi:myo-inositol-hexaphosphate 3-phosphohydrolase
LGTWLSILQGNDSPYLGFLRRNGQNLGVISFGKILLEDGDVNANTDGIFVMSHRLGA